MALEVKLRNGSLECSEISFLPFQRKPNNQRRWTSGRGGREDKGRHVHILGFVSPGRSFRQSLRVSITLTYKHRLV